MEPKLKEKVKEAINALTKNHAPKETFDVAKLSGFDSDYRIRIQTHRIKYTVYHDAKKIIIFRIERKKDRTYK